MRYNNINKMFQDFVNSGLHHQVSAQFTKTQMDVNVLKLDDAYIYEIALPGLSKNDISMKMEEKHLVVKVEKEGAEDSKILKKEFDYMNAVRRIPIPANADASSIKAAYKNGILSVSMSQLKKIENAKGSIEIK